MINPTGMNCLRNTYIVKTNDLKANNQPLSNVDYLNIGYMAGRFGINLSNNPNESNPIQILPQGTFVNINSCTSDLFEDTLNTIGIKFDRIA